MKKIIPILLSLLFVVALAVPVFASSANEYHVPVSVLDAYKYVVVFDSGAEIDIFAFNNYTYGTAPGSTDRTIVPSGSDSALYVYKDGAFSYIGKIPSAYIAIKYLKWSTFDIMNADGSVFLSGTPYVRECDGSTCPATDANHDNVCDDCGSVLTMSLRSSEYDYAVSLADGRAEYGYPFWAIFQQGERYVIHVSKNPMTSPDGVVLDGTDMMYTKTSVNENGSFSLSGWYNGYYSSTDSFVYANHTISNFPLVPPFLETMEEPIQNLGTEVTQKMMIILSSAVSLMACLVGLVLLRRFYRA